MSSDVDTNTSNGEGEEKPNNGKVLSKNIKWYNFHFHFRFFLIKLFLRSPIVLGMGIIHPNERNQPVYLHSIHVI